MPTVQLSAGCSERSSRMSSPTINYPEAICLRVTREMKAAMGSLAHRQRNTLAGISRLLIEEGMAVVERREEKLEELA